MEKQRILISKRIFDVAISLFILTITLPFTLVALIAIKVEQVFRGRPFDPLFYSETRMSYGKPFTLTKFNIFKYEQILEAKKQGKFIHTKYFELNKGITHVGFILKQIYMDELPQFFSVLKGDLSVVGPRPVNLEVYQALMDGGVTDKNRVPAGISGNYQSYKGTKNRGAVALDREYANFYHEKPWYKVLYFDLSIITRTILVVLRAKGV